MKKKSKVERSRPYAAPKFYLNRELSWVAFNKRVLEMAQRPEVPLLERIKFMAIFSSNLDEFFMIRVAGLHQQVDGGIRKKSIDGRTPLKQLKDIGCQVHDLVKMHTAITKELLGQLRSHGVEILQPREWTQSQRSYLKDYFLAEIYPILTPLAIQKHVSGPLFGGLQMNVALTVRHNSTSSDESLLIIPIPTLFKRFLVLPSDEGTRYAAVEDVIADNASYLAPHCNIESIDLFRLTRDADVGVKEDEASDLLNVMEAAVIERRSRTAVRLEISARASVALREHLIGEYELDKTQIYEVDGILDTKAFWQIVNQQGLDNLRFADRQPQKPSELLGYRSLWEAITDRDVLMHHPYESFEPVVEILQQAAQDPSVVAIKQTLYRTSSDSPIIRSLAQAAQNGKEVTVLVELKARFDEARNVQWARQLEDAGCHVVYGVVGLKTHAKALLIIRREKGHIQRYVHLSTGNYNDSTAKMYSDIGLFTSDTQLVTEVTAFFNMLTGFSESVEWSRLSIAPVNMKQRFIEMIDREAKASSPDRPGLIMAKTNSLEDKDICQALYRANKHGVKIRLNVRGICCLRPGMKGVSENIEVISVLGRYLEHARVFYFANGGHAEVYLSSADWMSRNLDKRLEILFPVKDPLHRKRCIDIMQTCLCDNTNSWRLLPDGTYQPKKAAGEKAISAQEIFHDQVTTEYRNHLQRIQRFRPINRNESEHDPMS